MRCRTRCIKTSTRADLGDLRVFNANGAPCRMRSARRRTRRRPRSPSSRCLCSSCRTPRRTTEGARIEVQTAGGTQVNVQEPSSPIGRERPHPHHRRATDRRAVRSVQFEWPSPDGASEVKVRIEASDDLDRWETVLAASTLLRAARGATATAPRTHRVAAAQYKYLRVQRADGGPPLAIHAVSAERVAPARSSSRSGSCRTRSRPTKPRCCASTPAVGARAFRALATAAGEQLGERDAAKPSRRQGALAERWSGETYLIVTDDRAARKSAGAFRTDDGSLLARAAAEGCASIAATPLNSAIGRAPALSGAGLGTVHARIRQSPRRTRLARGVRWTSWRRGGAERRAMIGEGVGARIQTLGGDTAFKPLPRKTPTRMIVLWSVLIVGVGLLVAMALSLLKRVRPATG